MPDFSPQFGGLWRLKAFQAVELVHDFTVAFRARHAAPGAYSGMGEWMERMVIDARRNMAHALRTPSGPDGIEERSISTARMELEDLLSGFREFMRREKLPLWAKDDPLTREIRLLAYASNRSIALYEPYLDTAEKAANCAISLIHQANFMLDQQVRSLQRRAHRSVHGSRPNYPSWGPL